MAEEKVSIVKLILRCAVVCLVSLFFVSTVSADSWFVLTTDSVVVDTFYVTITHEYATHDCEGYPLDPPCSVNDAQFTIDPLPLAPDPIQFYVDHMSSHNKVRLQFLRGVEYRIDGFWQVVSLRWIEYPWGWDCSGVDCRTEEDVPVVFFTPGGVAVEPVTWGRIKALYD
jgi:hypothetical protein